MPSTRIKVCCITTASEAREAVAAGAHAVGLVSEMPSGPGVIAEGAIAAIARTVPATVATFLLTSRQVAGEVAEQHGRCLTSTLQLCDRILPSQYAELRRLLPGVQLVQVVHVSGPSALDEALAAAGAVDALLLDSGNQRLAVKELGGTGRTHDWSVSRRVVEQSPVPVFLAGGLTPENVRAAIDTVGPFGVDVCSGLRTGGALDARKLAAFVAAVAA